MSYNNNGPKPCRNGCGVNIIFNGTKSSTGKAVPIDAATNQPHNCPRSPYNNGGQVQQQAPAFQQPRPASAPVPQSAGNVTLETVAGLLNEVAVNTRALPELLAATKELVSLVRKNYELQYTTASDEQGQDQ